MEANTVLTCSNPECGCQIRIEVPCPHGDEYTCACGEKLVPAASAAVYGGILT
jgi:hypothetical protein